MNEHYYTQKPTSKLIEYKIETTLRGEKFVFYTASSMFSPKKIDLGTKILIENADIKPNSKILDLGCGYGAVGITFAKICNARVTMTDINERATRYAKKNAKENNVLADIRNGNIYDAVENEEFDAILINPPQTAGRKTCNAMIEQASQHLNKTGTLQIVARHQKGGKQFEKLMKQTFGNVETVARKSGYRVYLSRAQ